MSTILKALRRLENDDSKKKRTGAPPVLRDAPAPLPATDPRAADALRGRILAEEAAARVGAGPREDEGPKSRRPLRPLVLATLAGAMLLAVVAFALTKSGIFSTPPNPDSAADLAASTSLATAEPAPAAAPANAPAAAPRAMVAVPTPLAAAEPPPTLPVAAPAPPAPAEPIAAASPDPVTPPPQVATAARLSTPNSVAAPAEKSTPPPVPQTPPAPVAAAPSTTTPAPTQTASARPTSPRPSDSIARPDASSAAAPTPKPAPVAAAPRTEAPAAIPVPAPVESAAVRPPPAAEPPRAAPRPAPEAQSAGAPEPVRSEDFKRVAPAGLAEVTVVRTAWHPKPERRSAKVRIAETDELVTAREGDTVAGLVLREITPSAVVFSAGDVEIRRRVGEKTAPH